MKFKMSFKQIAIPALLATSLCLVPVNGACAEQHSHKAETSSLRLSEIMLFQQIRHAKLWFAGRARNWKLAAFAVEELKEGFEAIEKHFPMLDDIPLKPMAKSVMEKELEDLEKSIAAEDRKRFVRDFDGLTAACNACHQSARHGFVVIKRPAAPPLTNQVYGAVVD